MAWTVLQQTAGMQAGDEAAFEAFYASYSNRMLRYLLVLARGDENAAQEVHQEAMVRVVRYIKPLNDDTDLWRFLVVTMRTAWIDHIRSRQHQQKKHIAFDPALLQVTSDEQEQVVDNRLQSALAKSLDRLTDDDRKLLDEHYRDGRSQAELADSRMIPLKTLSMRLVRLRRRLRTLITETLGHE